MSVLKHVKLGLDILMFKSVLTEKTIGLHDCSFSSSMPTTRYKQDKYAISRVAQAGIRSREQLLFHIGLEINQCFFFLNKCYNLLFKTCRNPVTDVSELPLDRSDPDRRVRLVHSWVITQQRARGDKKLNVQNITRPGYYASVTLGRARTRCARDAIQCTHLLPPLP